MAMMGSPYIRDYALRAVYGNWDYIKNHSSRKEEFSGHRLQWVAYIGGKRESRRLMGDVILCEQDLLEGRKYDDASFVTTWGMVASICKTNGALPRDVYTTYLKELKALMKKGVGKRGFDD